MSNNNGQNLAGKVAVITGGSRGIGAAITKRLAADGASVAFTYTKGGDAAVSVVNAAAERLLPFRRMPPMQPPSKPQSKRRSRPMGDLTYW
jgi:NAD(P)-dependent dehydrogenase (short-subunit alcohol dehydrogenase family)